MQQVFIAGPCVIESQSLLDTVAKHLVFLNKKYDTNIIFKASFDKANRTSISSFRGPGLKKGLEMLSKIKEKYALRLLTDIHESWQAKPVGEVVDVIQMLPQLDENFDKAVELMYRCRGKVIVTGVGKSGHIGAKIAATLSSTGTPSFFINPLDVFHGDLGVMTHDDLVLALSYSGQTDKLLRFIPMVLHMNIPIIGVSGNPASLLAKYSTVHLHVQVEREACPLNLAPTSSTTATLVMGDALAVALMKVRDFKPRDFAQFHPGGELGKRLLTTAADVMRTDDMPVMSPDMHLGDAIILVSKCKLGLGVAIVDGRITGLITDGDIRRAMEKWQAQFFDRTVSDIMTRKPKVVPPDAKISDIQKTMNKYKIHTVLVVDEGNHLLGVVDHYSCML